MTRSKSAEKTKAVSGQSNPFRRQNKDAAAKSSAPQLHVYRKKIVCDTDSRGHSTPGDRSPAEIVVDASEGFIPLWSKGTTLRWRFHENSLNIFLDPDAAKAAIRELFGTALLEWAPASPIKFAERNDAWDFEIIVREDDNCSINGCVLASAFFPDPGRHKLVIYPKMFEQDRDEQIETLIHEIGHIFGLRHFFADVSEDAWPSEIFGEHKRFSIMNYGHYSELTDEDKNDLIKLYQMVWNGELTEINGTSIRLMKPFSVSGTHE